MKRILKQLQTGFPEIQSVELDMKFASEEEMVAIPDATQYGKQSVGMHLVVVPCLYPKFPETRVNQTPLFLVSL